MATVLSSTGVADLVGNLLISVIGSHPSSLFVMLLFTGATLIMTTFISNTACQAVLTPLAASICMAGGMDPRGVVCCIATASIMVIAFPSGSGEAAATYALGEYNPGKVLKFTMPFMLLAWISIAVGANLVFPIYG
jgi:di/tricarboxylate transporter